jgi:outer membrane protein assembly factor BamB
LKIKWIFPTKGDVYATPSVVNEIVYAGDTSGRFYALTSLGKRLWETKVNGPITDSALVTDQMVIFGDQAGFIYGLERNKGKLVWSNRPTPDGSSAIFITHFGERSSGSRYFS